MSGPLTQPQHEDHATAALLHENHSRITVDDADSALGDDDANSIQTDTSSIKSSVLAYRIEHGRRFSEHGADYWGPNDDSAQALMDMTHELYIRTFRGELFLAPLENPTRAIDIGTGTGIWAMDFADKFPGCEVVGIDLSHIQPSWVPPNCRFEIDDADRDWTWPDNHFDYVHVRGIYGGITHWPAFYQRCLRILKPGGYLEHTEYTPRFESEDNTIVPGSPVDQCNIDAMEGYAKLNRPEGELNIADTMKERITTAGFVNVEETRFRWPVGSWPKDKYLKELGVWAAWIWEQGLEDFAVRIYCGLLGKSREEFIVWCAGIRAQLRDRKRVHIIWPMRVVVAQKPEYM